MQIVFMNRLSKNASSDQELFAQLWIGEEEGVWSLGWKDFSIAEETVDNIWYEGGSWSEMLCVYRHELAVKMGEGYRPLIEGIFHEEDSLPNRNTEHLKLQFYSEQHGNEKIYEELCAWRRGRSSSERKAPYILASNRLLRLLSTFLPYTPEELLQLPGVGQGKAAQYGTDWLAITSAAPREHQFPLSWVHNEIDDESFVSWLYKQKELKYKKQLERLRMRRLLLQGIECGLDMEQLKEECGVSRRDLLEAVEELEKDGYSVEKLIVQELGRMPQNEQEEVWNAYVELGDVFLKPVLYKVYGNEFTAPGGLDLYYERLRLIRIRFRREYTDVSAIAANY
ncbi:HRDC domain-containing protein [Paenibacillus wynnii]|uniref:Helicase n=1 Tax=Paenibacillus wynnii TaxID=268407 RepID=A0A098M7M1_9BACL|nr:HRDC domain-containing protein [Paenibacillus wynnii]KGE18579.1 helicase [Paenibacillus wynnii]